MTEEFCGSTREDEHVEPEDLQEAYAEAYEVTNLNQQFDRANRRLEILTNKIEKLIVYSDHLESIINIIIEESEERAEQTNKNFENLSDKMDDIMIEIGNMKTAVTMLMIDSR